MEQVNKFFSNTKIYRYPVLSINDTDTYLKVTMTMLPDIKSIVEEFNLLFNTTKIKNNIEKSINSVLDNNNMDEYINIISLLFTDKCKKINLQATSQTFKDFCNTSFDKTIFKNKIKVDFNIKYVNCEIDAHMQNFFYDYIIDNCEYIENVILKKIFIHLSCIYIYLSDPQKNNIKDINNIEVKNDCTIYFVCYIIINILFQKHKINSKLLSLDEKFIKLFKILFSVNHDKTYYILWLYQQSITNKFNKLYSGKKWYYTIYMNGIKQKKYKQGKLQIELKNTLCIYNNKNNKKSYSGCTNENLQQCITKYLKTTCGIDRDAELRYILTDDSDLHVLYYEIYNYIYKFAIDKIASANFKYAMDATESDA